MVNAFQFDQSAARPAGSMAARRLLVFRHDNELGSAPSHKLFDGVKVLCSKNDGPPRSFTDYEIDVEEGGNIEGVELIEMIE